MFAKSLIVAAASLMMVNAASIAVDVGKGGITFTPNTATAAKGDVLVFTFDSGLYVILATRSLFSRALTTLGIFQALDGHLQCHR